MSYGLRSVLDFGYLAVVDHTSENTTPGGEEFRCDGAGLAHSLPPQARPNLVLAGPYYPALWSRCV